MGTFCLVLHSHVPWLTGHGRGPVGEEWLYRAWTGSYVPVLSMLRRLADEGRRDLVTLGVTPVLAEQLDSVAALDGVRAWADDWWLRARHQAGGRGGDGVRAVAAHEFRAANLSLEELSGAWRHGGSAVLRTLAEDGVVELLSGPATHPFLPLLEPDVARWALQCGLDDARWRRSQRPAGLWSPECGHRDGLQDTYAAAGVTHVVYDEATFAASSRSVHSAWRMGATDVVAVARDLAVTDLVWSSRTGYPTSPVYRDLHAGDLGSGRTADPWYRPVDAAAQTRQDADAFVVAVRGRLLDVAAREGSAGLVVAAYDTELFGHWWHEGPAFLERVLRELPKAGVRLTTLDRAVHGDEHHPSLVRGTVDLADGSWDGGGDWSTWSGPAVTAILDEGARVQRRLVDVVRSSRGWSFRRPELDQLVRQAMLALSSDWASMVTRHQEADHARLRAQGHAEAFHRLAGLCESATDETGRRAARAEAERQRAVDGPFAWLDARALVAASG